jgi:hypothetical protein
LKNDQTRLGDFAEGRPVYLAHAANSLHGSLFGHSAHTYICWAGYAYLAGNGIFAGGG